MHQSKSTWQWLAQQYLFSDSQIQQYQSYLAFLGTWNKKVNLTSITDIHSMISHHLYDSLIIRRYIDFSCISSIADIGTGAGFPGLPIKIAFPHLALTLIEVNHKKREFLAMVVRELGLDQVTIIDLDWRTFLRHTDLTIDLFVARASVQPTELVRMFKAQSPYKKSRLVYWASAGWDATKEVKGYIDQDVSYQLEDKQRRLIFMKAE